jgi:hypothetical protein
VLPAQYYEGFKGQQQLPVVLYCIKISTDYFDIRLPNITDVLVVLYIWQLQNQKICFHPSLPFSSFSFMSHRMQQLHAHSNWTTPFFSGCRSHECQLSGWKDGYNDRWIVETS